MEHTIRRVVVIGMGAISPAGNNVAQLWDNLVQGVHGIGPITCFDTTNYKAKLAAQVKDFDPRAYMEKSDTLRSDRYAQFALAAACQAVEESGIIGTLPPDRVAVYFGSGIGGIHTFSTEHGKLRKRGPSRVSPFFVPMMIANMAAGMIAIRFNCQGAAMPSVTACASGSNAVGEVCGYGSTCDAYHITAPRPDADGGARAMLEALRESGWSSGESVYINAHGTGTPLNDAAETLAIKKALGEDQARGDEWFLQGHFLGNPVVPGVILCEILAQSACVLLTDQMTEGALPMYTGLNNVRFKSPVKPGDLFETKCRITRSKPPFYFAEGSGYVGERLCLKTEFAFAIVKE